MMFIYPKRWKVLSAFVVAAGMSMGSSGSVQAGEYCADSCCEPSSVFSSAGDRLSSRFKSICGLWKNDDGCVDDCVDTCLSDTCLVDPCTDGGCVDYNENPWRVGGWVQMGYHNRSNGLANSHPDKFNFHQNWLYVEKVADGSQGWDFGGRVDVMYGRDANFVQSFGNADSHWDYSQGNNIRGGYGWAVPQAYVEAAKGDFSVIAGRFLSPMGYESAAAPDNFFYSHSMTRFGSEAFGHTGFLVTQQVSDRLEAYYGWTLGWDTGFDQYGGGNNFLGGVKYDLACNTSLSYITSIGDLGLHGDGYSHSIVLDHTFGECNRWNYVFQTDYLHGNTLNPRAFGANGLHTAPGFDTETLGINQYLIYNVNEKLGVGGRFEWWRAAQEDSFSLTAGLNIKPIDHLIIRPEIRYYFADNDFANVYNNAAANDHLFDTFVFGIDAILVF